MRKAKAAVFVGANKDFEVREYPLAKPSPGQALLKLCISGICGTDLHIHEGRLGMPSPLIIGHEFIGEIFEINKGEITDKSTTTDGSAVSDLKVGDKVIFNAASPCGTCLLCRNGDSANCLNFEVAFAQDPTNPPHFFGGFAEYSYAYIVNLIKIPESVKYKAAAVYPCAGPTIIHALKLGGLFEVDASKKVETVVIQGLGPVGMFAVIWALKAGIKNVIVSARTSGNRADLARKLGVKDIVEPEKVGEHIAVLTDAVGADLAIECSGNPEAFNQGVKLLRNRGIYLVPGQYSDSGEIAFGPQNITFKALQIYGSAQYDTSDVIDYVDFLEKHKDIQDAIKDSLKSYSVDQINDAMAEAKKKTNCKVVLASPDCG